MIADLILNYIEVVYLLMVFAGAALVAWADWLLK